jgi:magnesium-transporting ATPase (P-type)
MEGQRRQRRLIDRSVLRRAFGVLGPTEAVWSLASFLVVLVLGGWRLGEAPSAALLSTASGTGFAAIVLGQLANAFACRSESRWVGAGGPAGIFRGNRLLLLALTVEIALLIAFLTVPPLPELLGGSLPAAAGWGLALLAIPVLWSADTVDKLVRARRRARVRRRDGAPGLDRSLSGRPPDRLNRAAAS